MKSHSSYKPAAAACWCYTYFAAEFVTFMSFAFAYAFNFGCVNAVNLVFIFPLLVADTDADGMDDGWEVTYLLDPLVDTGVDGASGDPDGDGLNNLEEYRNNTLPDNPDTDGDGFGDGLELAEEYGSTAARSGWTPEATPSGRGRGVACGIDAGTYVAAMAEGAPQLHDRYTKNVNLTFWHVDERVEALLAVLPGSNCGACGNPSCFAAAEAMVADQIPVNACTAGGQAVADAAADQLFKRNACLNHSLGRHACFGDAQVQGVVEPFPIHGVGHESVGRQHHGRTRCLHRNHDVVKIE